MAYRSPSPEVQAELDRLSAQSTEAILAELKEVGIGIDETQFQKICTKHHSITTVAKRWDARHGTSQAFLLAATTILWDRLCDHLFLWERFAGHVNKGIEQIKAGDRQEAVESWLEGWDELREFSVQSSIKDVSVFDAKVPQNLVKVDLFSWVQDIEMELTNQLETNTSQAENLLDFTTSFIETLPRSATPILLNMQGAQAIALFILGRTEEADNIYETITRTYSDDAWTFIDWGDQYNPIYHRNPNIVNEMKSRAIYERGLEKAVEDRDVLEERLRELD